MMITITMTRLYHYWINCNTKKIFWDLRLPFDSLLNYQLTNNWVNEHTMRSLSKAPSGKRKGLFLWDGTQNKKPRLLPGGNKRGEHTMRTLNPITTIIAKRL